MGFKNANLVAYATRFNSDSSAKLLQLYEGILDNEIADENKGPKHKTFAPSFFRCDRVQWFRLRGTEPDVVSKPDRALDFTAKIGTACHEIIQERLSARLGSDWLDVNEWIQSNNISTNYVVEKKGYETLVEFFEPFPVRFACDGLIKFNGKVYLLEIKTSELKSFEDMVAPKPKHIDQVKCYASLLNVRDVLMLYQDRQYGGFKCFELRISESQTDEIKARMTNIMKLVEANIAPDGLPKGDSSCTSASCPYFAKCKEWGRY